MSGRESLLEAARKWSDIDEMLSRNLPPMPELMSARWLPTPCHDVFDLPDETSTSLRAVKSSRNVPTLMAHPESPAHTTQKAVQDVWDIVNADQLPVDSPSRQRSPGKGRTPRSPRNRPPDA